VKNILIVCTANKTRSVMAMEAANRIAAKSGADCRFSSAGIAVMGSRADNTAKKILSEAGIETAHTPVSVSDLDLSVFDEIHVMTERQKTALCSYYNSEELEDKIRVLDIEDPYGKGETAYNDCLDRFKEIYEKYING